MESVTSSRKPSKIATSQAPSRSALTVHERDEDESLCRTKKKLRASGAQVCTIAVFADIEDEWELELIQISEEHSLYNLAEILCEKVLEHLRPDDMGGNGVDEHMWVFYRKKKATARKNRVEWESCGSEDSEFGMFNSERMTGTTLVQLSLRQGDVLKFDYDMGTMTTLVLKVLHIGDGGGLPAGSLPRLFRPDRHDASAQCCRVLAPVSRDNVTALGEGHDVTARFVLASDKASVLAGVPASSVAKEHQLDALFPRFANLVMQEQHQGATLGLCAMYSCETDGKFLSVDSGMADLVIAPVRFESMDELLSVAEKALAPDPSLGRYRKDCVSRVLVPAHVDAAEEADLLAAHEQAAKNPWGPKFVMVRFSTDESEGETQRLHTSGFEFGQMFPRTQEQLASGRFRWASFKGGVLRVCVGRASKNLQCKVTSICREWRCEFSSLHELMCAIEASWVVPGTSDELGSTALEVDADIGPNMLPPARPRQISTEDAALVLKKSSHKAVEKRALVTAMAFAGPQGRWLFTGFQNGRIIKWDASADSLSEISTSHQQGRKLRTWQAHQRQVAGMAESPGGEKLFTFSDSSVIRGWATDTTECILVHRVSATVHGHRGGQNVSCMVLHELDVGDGARLAFTVGLDNCSELFEDSEVESDEEAGGVLDEDDDANLLSYDAEDGAELAQWKEHSLPVRGLAVVPGRFLVSVAQFHEEGGGELIVWDLQNPEEVLRRLTPWLHTELSGLAVLGTSLLCMMDYGSSLSIFDLEAVVAGGAPPPDGPQRRLEWEQRVEHCQVASRRHFRGGYDDSGFLACCLVGHRGRAAAVNEDQGRVTLLDVKRLQEAAQNEEGVADDEREDGDSEEEEEEEGSELGALRRMAGHMGQSVPAAPLRAAIIDAEVPFPKRPLKRRAGIDHAQGGPEVIALRGERLVAGYADGSVRVQQLRQEGAAASDDAHPAPASFRPHNYNMHRSEDSSDTDDSDHSGASVDSDDGPEAGPEEYRKSDDEFGWFGGGHVLGMDMEDGDSDFDEDDLDEDED